MKFEEVRNDSDLQIFLQDQITLVENKLQEAADALGELMIAHMIFADDPKRSLRTSKKMAKKTVQTLQDILFEQAECIYQQKKALDDKGWLGK